MGWISAIIAEKVMKSEMGLCMNVLIGIIGSSLGRWLFGDLLDIGSAHAAGRFNVSGLLFGVLGACVLIFLLRHFRIMKK